MSWPRWSIVGFEVDFDVEAKADFIAMGGAGSPESWGVGVADDIVFLLRCQVYRIPQVDCVVKNANANRKSVSEHVAQLSNETEKDYDFLLVSISKRLCVDSVFYLFQLPARRRLYRYGIAGHHEILK